MPSNGATPASRSPTVPLDVRRVLRVRLREDVAAVALRHEVQVLRLGRVGYPVEGGETRTADRARRQPMLHVVVVRGDQPQVVSRELLLPVPESDRLGQ